MKRSTPTSSIDSEGTRRWHAHGKPHRTDGPAVEYANGATEWWAKGKPHRVDVPAIEYANGDKEWWVNGKRHRTDGPALERADGHREWYVNGNQHRADGPAIEWPDGMKMWWITRVHIPNPYAYVLTAVVAQGLPIPPKVFPDILKAMAEADGALNVQLTQLNGILHKYWPKHVQKILATLFMDTDPTVKNIALSLLGRQARQENTPRSPLL